MHQEDIAAHARLAVANTGRTFRSTVFIERRPAPPAPGSVGCHRRTGVERCSLGRLRTDDVQPVQRGFGGDGLAARRRQLSAVSVIVGSKSRPAEALDGARAAQWPALQQVRSAWPARSWPDRPGGEQPRVRFRRRQRLRHHQPLAGSALSDQVALVERRGWKGRVRPPAARSGARSELIQSMPWGLSTGSMRAEVGMPRSPTRAMRSIPKRLEAWPPARPRSPDRPMLPWNTSTAIGAAFGRADQAEDDLRSSRLPSRECRAASAQQRPVSRGRGQVVQHQRGARQMRSGQAPLDRQLAPGAASAGTARPRRLPRPASGPARWWRCPRAAERCVASLSRPLSTRAPAWPAAAAAAARLGAGAEPLRRTEPRAHPTPRRDMTVGNERSMRGTAESRRTTATPSRAGRESARPVRVPGRQVGQRALDALPFSRQPSRSKDGPRGELRDSGSSRCTRTWCHLHGGTPARSPVCSSNIDHCMGTRPAPVLALRRISAQSSALKAAVGRSQAGCVRCAGTGLAQAFPALGESWTLRARARAS